LLQILRDGSGLIAADLINSGESPMKSSKILSVAAGLLLASSLAIAEGQGQSGQHGGGHGGDRMARMQQHLGLSDGQVSEMQEIRANGGSREEMRAVLTDEQRAQADEMRARHRNGQKGMHGQPAGSAETADDA
jgi:hypothetical protein